MSFGKTAGFWLSLGIVPAAVVIGGAGWGNEGGNAGSGDGMLAQIHSMPVTHDPERRMAISPDGCRGCHAPEVEAWESSDHAHANHPASAQFLAAFTEADPVREAGTVFQPGIGDDGQLRIAVEGPDGERVTYPVEGVLGRRPLWQALIPFPGGRWQAGTTAYDPRRDEWFNVFEGEDRRPGEWGHWTGQGMNWNSNCAYCHMTEFKANFDIDENAYRSRWTTHGVSCVECHRGAAGHAVSARNGNPDVAGLIPAPEETVMNCASCHSRRGQLTADAFLPGDNFHDHFDLALPDQPGLYHPDGQIRDEVFVHTSHRMSRMGHDGVECRDCHDVHSGRTILPVQDNSLCLRCHGPGVGNAPRIVAVEHSHHPAGSTGNQCVECHMPQTTYMGRDSRRDHGYHLPDPLMTREAGIPNACNDCHADEGLAWQIEHAGAWYGQALAGSRQRTRARALHAAYEGEAEAHRALLALAETEEIPAWRATYTGLLGPYLEQAGVAGYLQEALHDEHPLVRNRVARVLSERPGAAPVLEYLSAGDERRNVRIAASLGLEQHGQPVTDAEARAEYRAYLASNADRPVPAFLLARQALRDGDEERFNRLLAHAVSLDATSPEVLRQGAVLASMSGDLARAEQYLVDGLRQAPDNHELHYSMALLHSETGDMGEAIAAFQRTVELEPEFARAWYNLSIALYRTGDRAGAREALQQAAPALSGDPGFEQMRRLLGL